MRRVLVLAASIGAAALLVGAAPDSAPTSTVATSSGSDPAIVDRVGQIAGTIYVGFAGRYGGVDWAVSRDGYWFTWEPDGAVTDPAVRAPGIPETAVEDWVDTIPTYGYRTVPGRIGVESTHDGGATWQPEWSLTDEQMAAIVNDNGPGTTSPSLYSYDLEVVDKGDGDYEVVVANGSDGFAVRATTGIWRRASTHPDLRDDGTLDIGTDITPPPVPIEWTAARNSPLPWSGVAWLAAVAALAIPLRRRFRRAGLWAAAPLAAIGAGILAWIWVATFQRDPATWAPGRIGLLGVLELAAEVALFAFALAALLAAALAALSLRGRHWAFVIGWAALVGLATLVAGNIAFSRLESVGGGAAVAAVTAAVLIGAGAALGARMRARAGQATAA